jgi:GNAT superfamily N-acetyltransferase
MGEPVDWLWRDRESFADAFSGYWTDREPESALVVETGDEDGEGPARRVVGYLLGCVDTKKVPSIVRVLWPHVIHRGLLIRGGTAPVLWRSMADIAGDIVRERKLPMEDLLDERWPSHLHIDLLPEARGRGLGSQLVERYLDYLRGVGSAGCHLETIFENRNAVAFFKANGFQLHGDPRPSPGWRSRSGERLHIQVMVRSL